MILNPHHGVKQCFHTMDVAVSDWATSEMGPTGPTTKNQPNHARMGLNVLPNIVKKKKRKK